MNAPDEPIDLERMVRSILGVPRRDETPDSDEDFGNRTESLPANEEEE